jgi:ABC-type transport system involved in multi-copper enzyme maturation permease subunit
MPKTFGLETQERLIKDFALSGISIFLIFLTIAISISTVPFEIENRTIYPILSKPLNRIDYLVGKFIGLLYLIFINTFVLTVILMCFLYLIFNKFYPQIAAVNFLYFLENILISAVVIFFSISVSPPINISLTFFVYIFGHMSAVYISYLTEISQSAYLSVLLWFMKTIVPQFEYFNVKDSVVYDNQISVFYVAEVTLYVILFIIMLFLLSYMLFNKKDL